MNACGQHAIANIGLHGSSIKAEAGVLPALQVLLGGGALGDGAGRAADRVIKIPSRRGPDALRSILDDYETNALDGEYFNDYYDRQGKIYFQRLLKPLADLAGIRSDDFIDWGDAAPYAQAIGVGECAGVMIDLVATLLYEVEEKLGWGREALAEGRYADSIYHSYSGFVGAAKALLLDRDVACNSQHGIIRDFDAHYASSGFGLPADFSTHVMRINRIEPSREFAEEYLEDSERFLDAAHRYRSDRSVKVIQNDIADAA
jgi:sulfite reductase (ferredoxin)